MFAGVGPSVAVLGGENADWRHLLGLGVDSSELLFQFGGVELLASDFVEDFKELVLADHDNVWVVLVVVLHRIVGGFGWNSAGVEHPFVAAHGHGELPHVLGLESLLVYLLLELENCRGHGGRPLGRISPPPVISMGVEVGDVWDDRIAVSQVGGMIPPVVYPVDNIRIVFPCHQSSLKCLPGSSRLDKLLDGPPCVFELGFAKERVYGLQVLFGGLFEGGHG